MQPGDGDERRAHRHGGEQAGRLPYLGQVEQASASLLGFMYHPVIHSA